MQTPLGEREWGGKPREFVIDLRSIATSDDFRREISRHFPLPKDHTRVWPTLRAEIIYQTGPYTIHFLGWSEFEQRMPRYARRLRRFLRNYEAAHGSNLTTHYR